jgi:PII-like signaling protein
MSIEGEGKLLRIFIGENDRWGRRPLYEELVRLARERQMAGATVIRGIEGFGRSSHLHTARILRLSEDLPLVIEIVDSADKVEAFLEEVEEMITGGMVTVERVQVHAYRGTRGSS